MKKLKKEITKISPDLLKKINQLLSDSGDESLNGIEISGLKFGLTANIQKQYWCCRMVNGQVVCSWQNKPC